MPTNSNSFLFPRMSANQKRPAATARYPARTAHPPEPTNRRASLPLLKMLNPMAVDSIAPRLNN